MLSRIYHTNFLSAFFTRPFSSKSSTSKLLTPLSTIPNGPLHGIRAAGFDGQICASQTLEILVRHGATGIKIEHPELGDPKRQNSTTTTFNTYNAGKFSISFDKNSKQDQREKLKLLKQQHVIIDNRSPKARKNDLILQKALRQRPYPVVYCAISGFGPDSEEKAYDRVIQAVSGMADLNGNQDNNPRLINFPLVDISAGTEAALQISLALNWLSSMTLKQKKKLSYVSLEVSMLGVAANLQANSIATYLDSGEKRNSIVPFDLYETQTHKLAIAVAKDQQFATLCDLLGLPELSLNYPTNELRRNNRHLVEEALRKVLKTKTAEEWEVLLKAKEIPVGPVKDFAAFVKDQHEHLLRYDQSGGKYVHSVSSVSNCFPARALSLRAAPTLNQDKKFVQDLVATLQKNPSQRFFRSLLSKAQAKADPNYKDGFYARLVSSAEIDFNAELCTQTWAEPQFFYAKKVASVFAREAKEGEKLSTQINGFVITKNIAQKNDYLITTLQGDRYLISKAVFQERYHPVANSDGSYNPRPIVMKMLRTTQDLRLTGPWGAPQYLRAGSVITQRSHFDVYGIDVESFEGNYRLCDKNGVELEKVAEKLRHPGK